EEGRKWAEKAIKLDKELVESHLSLGIYHLFYAWDWDAARRELDKVLAQKPDYAEAHHYMGHYYEAVRRLDLAEREVRDAVRLDPGSLLNQNELGWTLFFQGRDEEALKVLQDLRDADPTFLLARESLAFLHAIRDEYKKAMEEADALRRHAYVWPGADAIR